MFNVKFLIPVGLLIGLSACGATSQEQDSSIAYTQSQLPEGCKLGYAGSVKVAGGYHDSRIFYVTCGNTTTTSETHEEQEGKNTYPQTDVTVTQN